MKPEKFPPFDQVKETENGYIKQIGNNDHCAALFNLKILKSFNEP